MSKLRQILRLIHINFVLIKYGLDKIVLSIPVFAPLRFLAYMNPWNWFADKHQSRGVRIRCALEDLGPIFVKFGQTLSTRSDLLPEDIIIELEKLQDRVPPFSSEEAVRVIEDSYQRPISEVFASFDPLPKASASIAQVHEVRLRHGQRAVIKILRPGIEKTINRDIALLYTLARLAERYWSQGARLHPVAVVREFDQIIHDELDLMREGANAAQLRRNFTDTDALYIPEIYWPYARERVLAMEYVSGIPISDTEALRACQVNLRKLAERGVEIFFTQVFRDSFFHADMHPGNIFVNPADPENPQYVAVDFGIVGSLSPEDQRYLAYNILAFFRRDYRKVAELHIESGWVSADTRVNEFESAIRTVCEPIFEKPLREISFGWTLMRLFQTGQRFNMEVQPQLILLQKTLLHIEGLGRRLYPDLDLWATAKPYLEDWMSRQAGPRAFLSKVYEDAPRWFEQLPEMPDLVFAALQNLKNLPARQVRLLKEHDSPGKKRFNRRRWQAFFSGLGIGFAFTALSHYVAMRSVMPADWKTIACWGLAAIFVLFIAALLSE